MTQCPKYGTSAAMTPKCFAPSGICNEPNKDCPLKQRATGGYSNEIAGCFDY